MYAALCSAALVAASLLADSKPPRARIDFPLPSALTDAGTMRVRGSARDPDGIAAVHVNGVPASTADGFLTWWAVVPLELGENALVVETVDALGNLDARAAVTRVRRDGAIMRRPQGLALDSASGTCFVFDWVPDGSQLPYQTRILAADLSTGALAVTSSGSKGSGPLPSYATGEMEHDPVGGRLLLLQGFTPGTLLAVDTITGYRSVVSGDGVGAGPPFASAVGLELDLENGRAFAFNPSYEFKPTLGALLSVDLASGDRQIVSSYTIGSGPWPHSQRKMTREPGGQRLLVACALADLVLAIDTQSGDREIISDAASGLGTPWSYVWDVAAPAGGRAWVGSVSDGRLFGLDLQSGVHAEAAAPPANDPGQLYDVEVDAAHGRLLAADDLRAAILSKPLAGGGLEVLLRNSIGGGEPFRRSLVGGLTVDKDGRAWMVDHQYGELFAVGLADGVRTLVSGDGVGGGPELVQPVDVALDDSTGSTRALVLDVGLKAVVAVDLTTGDRSVLSGPGAGLGTALILWPGVVLSLEVAGGSAWVMDSGAEFFEHRLVVVDLVTGNRTLISGDGVGAGPTLIFSEDLAIDSAGGRAITFINKEVAAIDLMTGDRSVLSGAGVGSGPPLGSPVLVSWDEARDRALVYGIQAGVTAVDGTTGDRVLLAKFDETKGPALAWPASMALWQPQPGGEPILLLGDHELTALGALDLALDPISGETPAWRAIVSR